MKSLEGVRFISFLQIPSYRVTKIRNESCEKTAKPKLTMLRFFVYNKSFNRNPFVKLNAEFRRKREERIGSNVIKSNYFLLHLDFMVAKTAVEAAE